MLRVQHHVAERAFSAPDPTAPVRIEAGDRPWARQFARSDPRLGPRSGDDRHAPSLGPSTRPYLPQSYLPANGPRKVLAEGRRTLSRPPSEHGSDGSRLVVPVLPRVLGLPVMDWFGRTRHRGPNGSASGPAKPIAPERTRHRRPGGNQTTEAPHHKDGAPRSYVARGRDASIGSVGHGTSRPPGPRRVRRSAGVAG